MHPMLGRLSTLAYPLIRVMPVAVASELLAVVVRWLADHCVRLDKIRDNLRIALPELDDEALDDLTRRIAANVGRQIAEIVHIPSFVAGRRGARLEAGGVLEYPSDQKGPAIYVSGHLGNWELLPIVLRRYGITVTIIYTELADTGIDARLHGLRRATGATYIEKGNALRGCMKALARGESIALLVDQKVKSGIDVEFFGRRTRFTHLPARMALKFGCPIIPAEAVRLGPGHLKAVFHEPIWPVVQEGKNAVVELTQRMATVMEDCIRRHPDEWFCNTRRWKRKKSTSLNPSSSNAMLIASD